MTSVPPSVKETFNRTKFGFFGELGEGANAQVRFLQTALVRRELDSITLIEDIQGSESWDVRDLFQRNVDITRVNSSIIPYLKDPNKVKFFNPLTLILLPLDEGEQVDKEVPFVEAVEAKEDGHSYRLFEREGLFRFREHLGNPAFSSVQWNDEKVSVVAIDGQHRLQALKLWKRESGHGSDPLSKWTIPVVILGVFRANEHSKTSNLLEIVRNMFVYINTKAEEVNVARQILLDDESVTRICTQEIVQACHANDCKPAEKRSATRLPLMFFDWRGEVKWSDGRSIPNPAPGVVLKLEEVHQWLEAYIIDEDGSDRQAEVLNIADMVPPLTTFQSTRGLSNEDSRRIRERFGETVFPGVMYLLENFDPYKSYIATCRKIEKEANAASPAAQFAFARIRFGKDRAPENMRALVNEEHEKIVDVLVEERQTAFAQLIELDIGMRAVVSAFGMYKRHYDKFRESTADWAEYAAWMVPRVNALYKEGWFEAFDKLKDQERKLLTHIAYDPAGQITNYKIKDVHLAFGTLLALLMVHQNGDKKELSGAWESLSGNLSTPLLRGFRRQHRAEEKDRFEGTVPQFTAHINKLAEKSVEKRIGELEKYLDLEA